MRYPSQLMVVRIRLMARYITGVQATDWQICFCGQAAGVIGRNAKSLPILTQNELWRLHNWIEIDYRLEVMKREGPDARPL